PAAVVRARCGPVFILVGDGEGGEPGSVDQGPPWSSFVAGFPDDNDKSAGVVPVVGTHFTVAIAAATSCARARRSAHVVATGCAGRAERMPNAGVYWSHAPFHIERFVPGVRLDRLIRKLALLDGRAPPSLAARIGLSLVFACQAALSAQQALNLPRRPLG